MITSPNAISFENALATRMRDASPAPKSDESVDVGKRFEQMLWAEMLTHSGLEKAFTQNGGEAASAFSRYIVEAIAKDIAEKHPLGLSPADSGSTDTGAIPNE